MQFDWSTFAFEIINFIILIWLLQRFLYKPMNNVVENRQRVIQEEMSQASEMQAAADELKLEYEQRLSLWAEEKKKLIVIVEQDLSKLQLEKKAALDNELDLLRKQHEARENQRQQEWKSKVEAEALRLGAEFSSRLLSTLSGPELDQRIQGFLIQQLSEISDDFVENIRQYLNKGSNKVKLACAQPVTPENQALIQLALEQRLGQPFPDWVIEHTPELVAGFRLSIGGWVIAANLQDELRFFSESAYVHV